MGSNMSNALQEQLLKAGLTTEKKIQKENHAKRKKAKQNKKNKNKPAEIDESKLLALKAEEEKRQRDRELNRQKEEAAKQKAIVAQIKQLIETHHIDTADGDIMYHFDDNKLVKHIYVTQLQHDQIARGQLAIVKFADKYDVVPAIVARKIEERDKNYVVLLNDISKADEIDDEYADYQIPDDLMW